VSNVHGIAVRLADDDGDVRRASLVAQDLDRRRHEQRHPTGGAAVSCPTGDGRDQTSDPDSQVHNH
jgi:hypothetical protein